MSWSLHGMEKVPAAEAKATLDAMGHLPVPIRDYVKAGIDGLQDHHGADVVVSVTGHGHLCDSPSSYDVTTATIEVRRAT